MRLRIPSAFDDNRTACVSVASHCKLKSISIYSHFSRVGTMIVLSGKCFSLDYLATLSSFHTFVSMFEVFYCMSLLRF